MNTIELDIEALGCAVYDLKQAVRNIARTAIPLTDNIMSDIQDAENKIQRIIFNLKTHEEEEHLVSLQMQNIAIRVMVLPEYTRSAVIKQITSLLTVVEKHEG